jgi:hypothetical protein
MFVFGGAFSMHFANESLLFCGTGNRTGVDLHSRLAGVDTDVTFALGWLKVGIL